VELVQVDVVATDSRGSVVTDLTPQDFVVKEDGKVQTISHFYNSANESTRYPLTISFLIDTSYSMHERVAGMTRLEIAVKAAELVMDQLKAEDQIELIEFNNQPKVIAPFTNDLASVREKFKTINFQEANTAMHDSVIFSVRRIQERSGRKILVIFSDGMDSASKSYEEDVVEAIRRTDVTLITFYSEFTRLNFPTGTGTLGGTPNPMNRVKIRAGEDSLRLYTEMTGGQFFSFKKEQQLAKAMEDFRAIVGSQYTLAYRPGQKKSGWRKIKIESKRKGIHLRYREGYYVNKKA
jgi:Ca-activated chloride channel homolog